MAHQADHHPPVLRASALLRLRLECRSRRVVERAVIGVVGDFEIVARVAADGVAQSGFRLERLGGVLRRRRRRLRGRARGPGDHALALRRELAAHLQERDVPDPKRLTPVVVRLAARFSLVRFLVFLLLRTRRKRFLLVVARRRRPRRPRRPRRLKRPLARADGAADRAAFARDRAERKRVRDAGDAPRCALASGAAAAVLAGEADDGVHARQRGEQVLRPRLRSRARYGVHLVQHEHERLLEPPGDVRVQRGWRVQQRVPGVDHQDGDVGAFEDAPELAPHLDVLLKRRRVSFAGLDEPSLDRGDPAHERLALAAVQPAALELVVPLGPSGHQGHGAAREVERGGGHLRKRHGVREERPARVAHATFDVVRRLAG